MFVFAVVAVLLGSCKNDLSDEVIETSHAKTLAQYLFLDVFRQTLAVVPDYVANGSVNGASITISSSSSFNENTYPKIVTVDYGSVNQLDEMGINRKGKILVTILSDQITKGDFKISFEKFYLNDTRMLGEISSSYVGSASGDDYNLTLVDTSKITNGNGTMSFGADFTVKMTSGKQTFDVYDDLYTVSEKSWGQDFQGRSYTSSSAEAYIVDFSCRWLITSGMSEINPNDIQLQTLDMGNGGCEGVVTAEVKKDKFVSFQIK